jgi:PEP-CTERM motif
MSLSKSVVTALVVFVCLLVSSSAYADSSTDFSNNGGTLAGSNAGLTLSGSTLIAVTGYPGVGTTMGDLGSVSFTTGALSSGTLQMGGTFASGGTFSIDGNGTGGLTTLANGTHNYTLTGVVTGMMGGTSVNGVTVQLTINTGKGFYNGTTLISGGDTTVMSSVPEPSTLAMMGTGLLSLAGVLRRKVFARS